MQGDLTHTIDTCLYFMEMLYEGTDNIIDAFKVRLGKFCR